MTTPPSTPRKRGAQPGNTNALRHGFYSRYLRKAENDDLTLISDTDLASEIAMLRAVTRRVLALADGITDLDQAMSLLSTLSASSHRLANMIYKQRLIHGDADSRILDTISQAIADVVEELKLTDQTDNL